MKNENRFLKPKAVLVEFNADDVILTSDLGDVIDEGDTPNLPTGGGE